MYRREDRTVKEVTGDVSSRTAVDETGVEDPGGMETQLKVLLSSPLAKEIGRASCRERV